MAELSQLRQLYKDFQIAHEAGNTEEARDLAKKAAELEQEIVQEQSDRYVETKEQNPIVSFGQGAANAVTGAGRSIQQLYNYASGDDERLQELLVEQQEADFRNAPLRESSAGLAGGLTAELAMLAAPVGIAGTALRGASGATRLLGQSAVGAVEVPALMPSAGTLDSYGTEKAIQAGVGALAGGFAELGGSAINALGRRVNEAGDAIDAIDIPNLNRGGDDPSVSGMAAPVEEYTYINPAQRRFITEGDTEGLGAMQVARRMIGSPVQKWVLGSERATQEGIEKTMREGKGNLPSLVGRNAEETGGDIKTELLTELGEREAAERSAWDTATENVDDLVFGPNETERLFSRLLEHVRSLRPNEEMNNVQGLINYLSKGAARGRGTPDREVPIPQLSQPSREVGPLGQFDPEPTTITSKGKPGEGLTAGGLDNIRRDIWSYSGQAGSVENALVKNVYGAFNRIARDVLDEGGYNKAAASSFRDAIEASAKRFDLVDQKVKLPNRKEVQSVLSKAVNQLEAGTMSSGQFIDMLMSSRGSRMLEFLRETNKTLAPERSARIRSTLREAVMDKMTKTKLAKVDDEVGFKTDNGYKAVSNDIKKFMADNKEVVEALFEPEEIAEMERFSDAIRSLVPPDALGTPSGSAQGLWYLIQRVPIPSLKYFADKVARAALEYNDSNKYGKQIFGKEFDRNSVFRDDIKARLDPEAKKATEKVKEAVGRVGTALGQPVNRGALMAPTVLYTESE